MRYPTDTNQPWEEIEKSYGTMYELSERLGVHSPRKKFIDDRKANPIYRRQRRHPLELLGKILRKTRRLAGRIERRVRQATTAIV